MYRIMSRYAGICMYLATIIIGCNPEPEELPFYSGLDLTPTWLSEGSRAFDQLPTVHAFSLTDQKERTITNETLGGKIYVVNFFFTTCTNICPTMRTNLSMVQKQFSGNDRVRIVSHTIVPDFDNPDVLSSYGRVNNIDPSIWYLLTGSKEEISNLARVSYFVDLTEIASGGYAHTENLILVDDTGHIRGLYNGTLPYEVVNLIADMELLIK